MKNNSQILEKIENLRNTVEMVKREVNNEEALVPFIARVTNQIEALEWAME